ncbi:DNA-directed RNA polymerase subunit delta [Sporosarcina sp. G11-34]|uniref:DNA-directed RNA polymerase subunit delta n=1 Tax=Sporosarcina sp. G11-34 TaxID=2849605 RepID=UPI0022A96619|nr:DNA-directed RNA polymerase subunit delta [Sporosarcina sp. G11-34]
MTREQLAEESNIDIAYAVLAEHGESLTLRQLMDEVRKLNGVTVRAMADSLHRVNTDINIDGRFLSIDDIRWGLREWFPVEQLEVETAPVVRARRKRRKASAVDDDEEDDDLEEVDDDGFDKIDVDEDIDEDDDEVEIVEGAEAVDEVGIIDEDLIDVADEDDEVIPDDIVLDDDDEEDEEEDEEEED